MTLKLVRHFWGVDLTPGYDRLLPHWREVGYEAVEVPLQAVPDRGAFRSFLKHSGMAWIPQVFSHQFNGGGSVRQHLDSLKEQIAECVALQPLFINAHSGSDSWNLAQGEDSYGAALEMEQQIGVPISHETHRMRCFGNPWTTQALLQRFPNLKLTCDLSHWVCVAERLLEDCQEIIKLAARHCHHLHARVGYEEGPQVPDPRAPEWARHLAIHESWWDEIWTAQQQRGMGSVTLTPEFGPAPYLHALPYTQAPVADLEAICDWMARRQQGRFAASHPASAN
jgi:hypothetical protein